jgi:membrane AbrB-like protein
MVYGFTAVVVVIGGWIGAGLLRLPAGALAGSLVLGVIVKELGVAPLGWPPIVPEAAYAVIGVYVGLLFDQNSVQSTKRVLPYVIVSTVGLISACAGLSLILVALTGADLLTAYLAVTPGGIDSVAIMAVESRADASLVLTIQMLRLFVVVLVGMLISRLVMPHR